MLLFTFGKDFELESTISKTAGQLPPNLSFKLQNKVRMKFIFFLIIFLSIKNHAQCCKANKISLDWQHSNNVTTFRGKKTVINCTAQYPFDFNQCKISLRNKTCNAADRNGTFMKLRQCDKLFQDVIFKRVNDRKTCQAVIEDTKLKHGGTWKCGLQWYPDYSVKTTQEFLVQVQNYLDDVSMIWIVASVEICIILMGSLSFGCLKYFEEKREAKIENEKKLKIDLKTIST